MAKKVTETGPVGLRGIRNSDLYKELSALSESGDEEATSLLSSLSQGKSRPFSDGDDTSAYYSPQQFSEKTPYATIGESQYDEQPYVMGTDPNDVNEIRYENQSGVDVLANGVGKMLGTAATTFVSSLVGLPYGLLQTATQGRASALWDNDVTQGLANVDKWMEENMTNYQSQAQQQDPTYRLGDMNWWADNVIKNAGFTLGAAASMAVGAGGLGLMSKALGFVDKVGKGTKGASNFLSALFSATGEGMIEARQGVEERNKREYQRLEDEFAPYYDSLEMQKNAINQEYALTRDYNAYRQQMQDLLAQKQALDEKMNAGKQQIHESGLEMGNAILLANQALLTAGNIAQFSKGMTKSFDKARHAVETAEKYKVPFGASASRVSNNLKDGYKVGGKWLGRTIAATKGIATEGSEEMNQQWIQSSSGAAYNEEDVNDYWRAKTDRDSYRETTKGLYTLGNIIGKGFNESWGDFDQWEQFLIGGMTGAMGSYMPTKIFNQDKTKSRFNPMRYGEWSGGAIKEVGEFNKQYNEYEENVNELNRILASEDFPQRVRDMVGHSYTESQKEAALEADDKKAYKDADDKQTVHDIQSFLRAGKIDDLRAIYDEIGKEMDDEDVKNIIKSTTKVTKDADGKEHYEGPYVDEAGNQIVPNDEIRKDLKHNSEELNRKLDSYLDSVKTVNEMTRNKLSKDQEDNLTYLHHLSKEKINRFEEIMQKVRKELPKEFIIKTNKSPEQLAKENASSDLAFTKDDTIPEGYVKIDTSLMNDKNFGAFFMNTVMRGDNIQPEMAEEEEKPTIEEDDTDVKEQKKKVSDFEKQIKQTKAEKKLNGITKEAEDQLAKDEENLAKEKEILQKLEEKQGQKKTKKQKEREKKAEDDRIEQQIRNINHFKKEYFDRMRKDSNKTLEEINNSFKEIENDIKDAARLQEESGEFYETFLEYMANPQMVEQKKEEEEKKSEKKKVEEDVSGMSVRELAQRADLKELLKQAKDKSDIAMINNIKRAMVLRQQQAATESAGRDTEVLKNYSSQDKDMAIKAQMKKFNQEMDRVSDNADFEKSAEELAKQFEGVDFELIEQTILENASPSEKVQLEIMAAEDPDAYMKVMEERSNTIAQAINELEEYTTRDIPDIDMSGADVSEEDKANYEAKKRSENMPDVAEPKVRDEVNPVVSVPVFLDPLPENPAAEIDSAHDDNVLQNDMQASMDNPDIIRSGQHPWRAVTRRVGYKTNEPYSKTLEELVNSTSDESQKEIYRRQLKRTQAVEKFFEDNGVYTRVENGAGERNTVIKFKVFSAINKAAEDFVVFMIDSNGVILGDLPSGDIQVEPNTNQIEGLADFYEEAKRQWEELDDAQRNSTDGVMLKGLETRINNAYIGKVRYQNERQSINALFNGGKFTLAIRVGDTSTNEPMSALDTGKRALSNKAKKAMIINPKTGSKGQPYVLIPTSKSNDEDIVGEGYFAVPISTPLFGEINPDSVFYRVVKDILQKIKDGSIKSVQAKELLQNMFGVGNVHVNFEDDNTRRGTGITITTYRRENNVEKGNPYDIYKGSRENLDVDAALQELGRFYINISNKKINDTSTFYNLNGTPVDYNTMVGEIAETNAAASHTVNDFFTIVPLEKKDDGSFKMVEKRPSMMSFPSGDVNSLFHVTAKYKDGTVVHWTIDPSPQANFTCKDEQGRPITNDDDIHTYSEKKLAAQYRAEAFGRFYMKDFSKPFAVFIDGKTVVYDPIKKTFNVPKILEETAPRYNSALEQYESFAEMLENSMAEAAEQLAGESRNVTPQEIGQAMVDHIKDVVDIDVVDDAQKAAEGLTNAQMMVIGEKGAKSLDDAEEATTRMDNLSVANEMEQAGKDALAIKIATGWERGADGKWRYEIPDIEINGGLLYKAIHGDTSVKLTNLIYFKDENLKRFLAAYPILKDYKIIFRNLGKTIKGSQNASLKIITFNPYFFRARYGYISPEKTSEITYTLVHEIQHVIQHEEGFSGGSNDELADQKLEEIIVSKVEKLNELNEKIDKIKRNYRKTDTLIDQYYNAQDAAIFGFESEQPLNEELEKHFKEVIESNDEIKDLNKKIEKIQNQLDAINNNRSQYAKMVYYATAGEVEARTASKRMGLSMEERRNSLFTEDMYKDVAKKDLIFLQNGLDTQEIQSSIVNNSSINMLKVNGKILGFEHNGKIVLQKDAIDPNLPMHEYTHLWDRVIKTVDPRLWNKGKDLMKRGAPKLWKQIAEDENYGKRWEKEGKTAEELEDLIASEVHARLTGEGFASGVEKNFKAKEGSLIEQLKAWVLEAFKKLAKTLGMSDSEVNKLTLDDFRNMTIRDFMEKGITMNTIQTEAQKNSQKEANIKKTEDTIKKIQEDSRQFVLTDVKGNENPEGNYYKNRKDGTLHARVTSMIEGDSRIKPFKETKDDSTVNPWILPSTSFGDQVDEFIRAFFNKEDTSLVNVPNLSENSKKELLKSLNEIQRQLTKEGWKVASRDIMTSGLIAVSDANGDNLVARVAGTLDLLLYNPETNEYAIWDIKTHRGEPNVFKWRGQISMYKQMLEVKYPEMKGRIKELKVVPFKISGYDADTETFTKSSNGMILKNGKPFTVEVKYDGSLIDIEEVNLNINMGREGFKKEYNTEEGRNQIIYSKPAPKPAEAPKQKVKEGIVKTVNKIAAKYPVSKFLKAEYKSNNEAVVLCDKLDEARKNNNMADMMLTEAEMAIISDMLNTSMIDKFAMREKINSGGMEIPDFAVNEEGDTSNGVEDEARKRRILIKSTESAWNRLSDDNKQKAVKSSQIKEIVNILKTSSEDETDPNEDIRKILHRKAVSVKGYKVLNLRKELEWLDKILPQLSRQNKVKIIEGLIRCSDGTWDYGQLKNGILYIGTNGMEGTVYHEAFHAVTQWILADEELDSLYEAAKKRYGNLDTAVLEEKMADDFMLYTMGVRPSYEKKNLSIFQRLWRAIKRLLDGTSMIDKLYADINNGVYAGAVMREGNNEFAGITSEDRKVTMKYSFIAGEMRDRLKDNSISREQYEILDAEEKEYLFHCVI